MARGLDAGKYFWRSGREKCFSLDIPFNRTSGPPGSVVQLPNCPYAPEESLCETDDEHRASDRLGRKVRPMTREPDVARRTTRREDGSAGQHRALIVRVSLTDARGQLSS